MTTHRFLCWKTPNPAGTWLVMPFATSRFHSIRPWEEPTDPDVTYAAMRYNDLGARVAVEYVAPPRVEGERVRLTELPDFVQRALLEEFT